MNIRKYEKLIKDYERGKYHTITRQGDILIFRGNRVANCVYYPADYIKFSSP